MALAKWQRQKPIQWKTFPRISAQQTTKDKPHMFIFFGSNGHHMNHYPALAWRVDRTRDDSYKGGVFQYCYAECHPHGGYHYKEPSESRMDENGRCRIEAPKLTFKAGLYRDGGGLGDADSHVKRQRRSKVRS